MGKESKAISKRKKKFNSVIPLYFCRNYFFFTYTHYTTDRTESSGLKSYVKLTKYLPIMYKRYIV